MDARFINSLIVKGKITTRRLKFKASYFNTRFFGVSDVNRNSSSYQALTMIGYIFALLPLYVLVYLPLSHMFSTSLEKSTASNFNILNTSFITTDEPLLCPSHSYITHILSLAPLIIYIEDFLRANESKHLLNIR